MASAVVVNVTCMALMICMALGAVPLAMATLTCCQVKPVLEKCDCYVRNGGDTVPESCCLAIMSLENEAKSTLDRQIACRCIQEAVQKIPDLNATAFASVPQKCGIPLTYNFSPTMDCNRVH